MTRISEKLRISSSSLLRKSTRFLSLKLANLSLPSTLHYCKSLVRFVASKTLAFFFFMEDIFSNDDDIWDLDSSERLRPPQRPRLFHEYEVDYDDNETEKVYLVPYRWWKEAQDDDYQIGGVLYSVSSNNEIDSRILLSLRKEEDPQKADDADVGCSGFQYALVGEAIWLRALKRHTDLHPAFKDSGSFFSSEEMLQEVFPLQIRLSVSWDTNSLLVKISQNDNLVEFYKRACIIFGSKSQLLHIWDFSGQITQFLINERMNLLSDAPGQQCKEILLELQVHGFLHSIMGRDGEKIEMVDGWSNIKCSPVMMNGSTDNVKPFLSGSNSSFSGIYRAASLGLIGLQNLGNTCFMNSAIQCLVHTPKLVDYFLSDYRTELNHENPLGMNGELALAFGDLVRKLWTPRSRPVAPRMFKLKLANFAPQFSGYNQHDSQEFLAFLLDGLHEDLNRVKCKPYIEVKDAEGRPDEEVAGEYWQNHLARNDSIIVDVCQGQYRSKLVCPTCNKSSVTFDPFMYLSLPLPSTMIRSMTLTVFSTNGVALPSTFTIMVPQNGNLKDLTDALSTACFLRDDETLLVAEIYRSRVFRFLDDPIDLVALIRDEDKLVAYRLPKDSETSSLIVFIHQQLERHDGSGKGISIPETFGIPLVARLSDISYGYDVRKQFLKLLDPFLMPNEDVLSNFDDDTGNSANEDSEMDDASGSTVLDSDGGSDSGTGVNTDLATDFKFYIARRKEDIEDTLIRMNEPVFISRMKKVLEVPVLWSKKMIAKYDTCLLSTLPEVFKSHLLARRPQESVSLYRCLEAFLKEEPLGPEDMWHCPSCKRPQQASKKLDLWRLPETLIIHLKRFSYSRFSKNKLETVVDFPVDDLDFSSYISVKNGELSTRYRLYAISNHYGGMGGGHYTAYVSHGGDWYEFDDDRVSYVGEDGIKTSAAYILFYRRVENV